MQAGKRLTKHENGKPVLCENIRKWSAWFEHFPNRFVKETKLDNVRISTIFLGIDHNFTGRGGPVLWETMVFKHNPRPDAIVDEESQEEMRARSREEALVHHDMLVKKWENHGDR